MIENKIIERMKQLYPNDLVTDIDDCIVLLRKANWGGSDLDIIFEFIDDEILKT